MGCAQLIRNLGTHTGDQPNEQSALVELAALSGLAQLIDRAKVVCTNERHSGHNAGRKATVKGWPVRGVTLLAIFIGAGAGGLLYWSWVSRASAWGSGLLVQFGSTLVLFVPLLVVGRGVEARLDRVSKRQDQISTRQEETASDVARLTEEVAQTQADLRLTREQLSEVVRERITANKSRDSALFKAVGEAPSQADVLNSLIRAKEMGIIPAQGCRVGFISDCYLRFTPEWQSNDAVVSESESPDVIELTLERIDATLLSRIMWDTESAPSEIAVQIAEAMQASGVYPGDNSFDAGKIFADLSALLTLGYDSITRGAVDPIRHIIQFCPPQWAVCDDGIYCTQHPYMLPANGMDAPRLLADMNEKAWADMHSFEEASTACRALFKSGSLAIKPHRRHYPDEPPF